MNPDIVRKIMAERDRQDDKWGADRMLEDSLWLTILAEEVGECAKGILKHHTPEMLEQEVVQVAAVAVAWLECFANEKVVCHYCGEVHKMATTTVFVGDSGRCVYRADE